VTAALPATRAQQGRWAMRTRARIPQKITVRASYEVADGSMHGGQLGRGSKHARHIRYMYWLKRRTYLVVPQTIHPGGGSVWGANVAVRQESPLCSRVWGGLGDVPEQTGEGAQIGESRALLWDPVCWGLER
jgi:hypothetical protein